MHTARSSYRSPTCRRNNTRKGDRCLAPFSYPLLRGRYLPRCDTSSSPLKTVIVRMIPAPLKGCYFRHLLEEMRRHRTKRACIHLKVGAAVRLENRPKTGTRLETLCYRAQRSRCLLRSCLDAYVADFLSGMENAAPAATHSRRKKASRPSMASLRRDERKT